MINKFKSKKSFLAVYLNALVSKTIQESPKDGVLGNFNQKLYEDFHVTILPTLLRNYDRYSMANGIEVRMPFMDYRLVSFCFSLRWQSKLNKGYTKTILRDAMAPFVPQEVIWRKSKVGFNTPFTDWMKGSWKNYLLDLVHSAEFAQSHLIDSASTKAIVSQVIHNPKASYKDGEKAWSALMPYLGKSHVKKFCLTPYLIFIHIHTMNRQALHRTKEKALCYAWQYVPNTSVRKLQNIYHATVQKAGSLWVRRIFNDLRIRKITGLSTFPQYRYEWDEFHKSFPAYSFIPGLYISYDLYEEIEKPEKYKTFFVMRDPRDIVVSWYYSMLKTHILMGKVGNYRNVLQSMSYEDGITYCIKTLALKFAGMRTWMYNQEDPKVLIIKFEELTATPLEGFKKIFNHCEIDIPETILKQVLDDYTKSKLRENDLKKRDDKTESHYRKEKSTYKTGFTDKHLELFYAINGDLLNVLGYADK